MFLKNFNVKNKTALVTGSGKGIGKACAIALAEAGANVIILSRTEKDLLIVQNKIKKLKKKCSYYVCDVTNLKEIKKIFFEINKLDILVNNAGTNRPEYFTKIKRKDMSEVVDLNIKASFDIAQLATKVMLKSKNRKKIGGSIINISSQFSLKEWLLIWLNITLELTLFVLHLWKHQWSKNFLKIKVLKNL